MTMRPLRDYRGQFKERFATRKIENEIARLPAQERAALLQCRLEPLKTLMGEDAPVKWVEESAVNSLIAAGKLHPKPGSWVANMAARAVATGTSSNEIQL